MASATKSDIECSVSAALMRGHDADRNPGTLWFFLYSLSYHHLVINIITSMYLDVKFTVEEFIKHSTG